MKTERFEEVYDEYADRIYRFIYYKMYHTETAEDILSQVFLKAYEKWESYDPDKGSVSSWLYAIAGNTVIDHYRKKRPTADIDDVWDLSSDEDIQIDAERKDQMNEIRGCLEKIDREQRDLVIMRIWDELSFKEIADITGKTEAGCKMSFYRALKKLKTFITVSVFLFIACVIFSKRKF